ncbi:AarF/ABC1/UbiB kinase family protein [aff. Roholtiella sp. LEGE 12411]|nr:AarF/UbiB family protein [aff. Roholtiella sp. LEGE 12411]MBE9033670.1 AarF/ABC1/UbiB kinase family protein [aff. Roholtiella sp. LEGE 12411]
MLKEKYIPTPLVEKKQRKKVEIVEILNSRRFSITYVIWRFIVYFLGVSFRRFIRKPDLQKTAIGLREIFEELGGLWVKTGQLLALRTDIFPEEVCDQLLRLQYGALGFPMELVRSTIESELGAPIEKIFVAFDEEPLAAASIAQIHTAVLSKNQTSVVVKVQRPGLEVSFKRDLDVIKFFANLLRYLNIGNYLRLDEAVLEVERIFNEELDYRYEASNMRRMKKTLKKHGIYTPSVYKKYSKRRVLVMEYIPGVLMADYIKALNKDPAKVKKWDEENNVNRKKLGEKLFLSLFRQIFEDNLYHADLHPGNIFLLRDSKFVLIDMGSVGSLDKDLRTNYLNYTNALGKEDFPKAADYIIRFAVDIPRVNIPRVRAEMSRAIEGWADKSRLDGLSYKEKSLGGATSEISKVSVKYSVPTNWGFLKVSRSLITLDGSLQYLIPDFSFLKSIKKYSKQAERRALIQSLRLESIMASVNNFFETVDEYNTLILPKLRERTIPFDGTINKFALSLAFVLRTFSYAILIGGVILAYAFLFQHHFASIKVIHNQLFDEIARQIPPIPYLEWILIFIAMTFIFRTLSACSVILEQKEYEGKSIL